MITKICIICGKKFPIKPYLLKKGRGKFCSLECYWKSMVGKSNSNKGIKHPETSGKNHWNWKGGKYKNESGYQYILKPEHLFCNCQGYVFEHRLIAEKYLGRYLTPKEQVHHIGIKYPMNSIENKSDNRPENLYLFLKKEHDRYHGFKIKPILKSNLI